MLTRYSLVNDAQAQGKRPQGGQSCLTLGLVVKACLDQHGHVSGMSFLLQLLEFQLPPAFGVSIMT